jgi:hypothetical protein
VFAVQRAVLNQLMSDVVAERILDSQGPRHGRGADAPFQLSELYARLDREVWSELASGADIPSPRRELQREHLNRLALLLLRPSVLGRADTRGLARGEAVDLLARIRRAERRSGLSADAMAHLRECEQTLQQVLSARTIRGGV